MNEKNKKKWELETKLRIATNNSATISDINDLKWVDLRTGEVVKEAKEKCKSWN